MKEQKVVVKAVPKYSEELKNSAQRLKSWLILRGKKIGTKIPSYTTSPTPRVAHRIQKLGRNIDSNNFQKVVKAY